MGDNRHLGWKQCSINPAIRPVAFEPKIKCQQSKLKIRDKHTMRKPVTLFPRKTFHSESSRGRLLFELLRKLLNINVTSVPLLSVNTRCRAFDTV